MCFGVSTIAEVTRSFLEGVEVFSEVSVLGSAEAADDVLVLEWPCGFQHNVVLIK